MVDNNKSQIKRKLVLLTIILCSLVSTSCAFLMDRNNPMPELIQETHEPLAELEQYVYNTVGPNVYFKPPIFDEEESVAKLTLIQYEYGMDYALFDDARTAINDYLEDHPECILNEYNEILLNYEKRKKLPHNDYDDHYVTYSSNCFSEGGYPINGSDTRYERIDVRFESISVVQKHSPLQAYYGADDIYIMDIWSEPTCDEIIEIVENIPSLKYIFIVRLDGNEEELLSRLQAEESDVIVIRTQI